MTPPDAVIESARRLLRRSSAAPFERSGALLASAAAVLARATAPAPVALAFHNAAALAARDRLPALGHAIPAAERAHAFIAAEVFLARIDPVWAWSLACDLLPDEELLRWPSLGLHVAARMPAEEARSLLSRKFSANALFAREFESEAAARRRALPDTASSPSAAETAAAALVDPERGFELAERLLDVRTPWDVADALSLIATAAVAAGRAGRVTDLVRRHDFVSVQVAWLQAAALSGALPRADVIELAGALSPRLIDELDPGQAALAGAPLLVALGAAGAPEPAVQAAIEWQVSPVDLVELLFYSEACPADLNVRPLLAANPDNADRGRGRATCWLDPAEPVQSCADAVAVAAARPWRPIPGSLPDRIDWPLAVR